ncbi:MAG: glycosyltransferase family A protein [Xanthobacteraceae bacterium]
MKPFVSVIIPTRNRPDMLREAMESVSQQTFTDYELIVVVNGPDNPLTEKSLQVAADGGGRVIRVERTGIAVALNAGMKAAAGEWLAFLDDDDLWEPNKLELELKVADGAAADVVFCDSRLFDGADSAVNRLPRPPLSTSPREAMTLKNYGGGCSSTMVKRAAALAVGGFDEAIVSPDWDFWMRLSWRYRVAWADACTALVRQHPGSTSKQISWAYWTLYIQLKALRTLPHDLRHLRGRIVWQMLKVAMKGAEASLRHRCLRVVRRIVAPETKSHRQPRSPA